MNALLQQIADAASDDLRKLIEEGSEDILKAIHKTEQECQLQESAPKFSLGFKITVDLDKSTFDCQLGWSFKQSLQVSHQIEDVNQTTMPLGDTGITIKTGDLVVNTTASKLKRAADKLKRN